MDAQDFKARRTEMKLTQAALAAELGVTEATIANYESGRSDVPRTVELAIETLLTRARDKQHKTLADWEAQFKNLLEIERAAFKRMNDSRPWTGPIIVHNLARLAEIEKWDRDCRAWHEAKQELLLFASRFRKLFPETNGVR